MYFICNISGIFAYLNYLTPKSRQEIVDLLIKGLQRLEYRGYDSAGIAVDTPDGENITILKETGKVKALEDQILLSKSPVYTQRIYLRWFPVGYNCKLAIFYLMDHACIVFISICRVRN